METKPLFRKVFRSAQSFGEKHADTKYFNDFEEVLSGASDSIFARLSKLVVYFGKGISSNVGGAINGIKGYYTLKGSQKIHKTAAHRGRDGYTGKKVITFQDEEYIAGITLRKNVVITKLLIETTSGKRYEFGVDKGEMMNFSLAKENKVAVGFFGGYGGHLHNLGFYYANKDLIQKLTFQKIDLESLPDAGFSVRALAARDLKVTDILGRTHRDTVIFDHVKELSSFFKNFCSSTITSLTVFYGENCINGIQASYLNLNTLEEIATDEKFGPQSMSKKTKIELAPGECITFFQFYYTDIITALEICTTRSKYRFGASKIDSKQNCQSFDPIDRKARLIAFRGGFGGHLHNFSLYYVEQSTYNYYRRSPFILLYYMIKRSPKYKAELNEYLKKNAQFSKRKEYLFIRACMELDWKNVKMILKYL